MVATKQSLSQSNGTEFCGYSYCTRKSKEKIENRISKERESAMDHFASLKAPLKPNRHTELI